MRTSGDALQRLKAARRAANATAPQHEPNPSSCKHAAAASDGDNEAYMRAFEAAFAGQQQLSTGSTTHPQHTTPPACPPAARGAAGAAQAAHPPMPPGWRTGPVDEAGVVCRVSERPVLCSAAVLDGGTQQVVLGSSDHALYVVDASTGRIRRTLFSKTAGHTEWVTSVCCLPGGWVLSGGMDGRLWLWPAAGSAGSVAQGEHAGPVSQVALLGAGSCSGSSSGSSTPGSRSAAAAASSRSSSSSSMARRQASGGEQVLAVSCSYDKSVKLWDVSSARAKQLAVLSGHAAPVLELAVAGDGSTLLTGDRNGCIMCWNVGSCSSSSSSSSSWGVKDAHTGHVTALAWQQQQPQDDDEQPNIALSGGQDGCLRAWDSRQGRCIAQQALHAGSSGRGAVTAIMTVTSGASHWPLVVTAGADKTLRVCDPAAGYRPLHTLSLPDFPYSLTAMGGSSGLVACGCGDGSLHIVDAQQGTTLYALGAGRAALRCLTVLHGGGGTSRLVASGDDGCVACYSFA